MIDRKHLAEFILLIFAFAVGVFIFFTASNEDIKRLIVVGLALLYPVWGIWHHHEHGHLNRFIAWEYGLVGMLVLVSFLGILS